MKSFRYGYLHRPSPRKKLGTRRQKERRNLDSRPVLLSPKQRRARHKCAYELVLDTGTESDIDSVFNEGVVLQQYDDDEDAPKAKRLKMDVIELSDDEEPEPPSRARGTKSRPISL